MTFHKIHIEGLDAVAELSTFTAADVTEHHAIIHVLPCGHTFAQQLDRLQQAEQRFREIARIEDAQPVFKRYFLSDSTNQAPLISDPDRCTISYIQQPPLDGSKVALWVYMQQGTSIEHTDDSTIVSHNGYKHIYTMGLTDSSVATSFEQTDNVLNRYIGILDKHSATLEDHCLRTWFFVRDVDTQYAGLVRARRELFTRHGLTPQTHYIASTGIGGNPSDPRALIQLGGYAITGFTPSQQRYLYALSHLNRTHEYGVTFERATLMQYGDRDHIYISGTASINNRGEVVHVGDIALQCQRMWENVDKLLEEGGMGSEDIMQIIVYLRDCADYALINEMFQRHFPHTPCVITLAPVCRPTWLIEMECIAVKARKNNLFRDF